jgi:hypothetical protein
MFATSAYRRTQYFGFFGFTSPTRSGAARTQ